MMNCINCGERMSGDGFNQAFVCPNSTDPESDFIEPDGDPTYCIESED